MKKRVKYLLMGFSLAVLLLAAMVSLVIWAWNSAEGTRLLLKTVSFFSPVRIDVEKIQGRLRDELTLQGVNIRWAQGEIHAERLHLKWQPEELWNRRLIVNELSLSGVIFQDRGSEETKPFFPGWPLAPFWLTKIQGRIDSFRLHEGVYLRRNQDPIKLGQLFSRGEWDGKALALQDCALSGPWGSAEGSMKMGFAKPFLILDLKASSDHEYNGMDRLAVKLLLAPTDKPDEAAGTIRVSGQKQNAEVLGLESELGLTPAALSWRNFRFLNPGRKGTVQSEGSWSFGVRPSLQGRFIFDDADLAPELGMTTNLFGELEIKGPLENYRGRVSLVNKVKGWPEFNFSGEIEGDLQRAKISNLNASWLDGGVEGLLSFSWAEAMTLEGKLQGKKLNPGRMDSEWPGDLNLKLDGKVVLGENRRSEAMIKANFSESRLRGWPFVGEVNASLEKDLWKISELHLRGQGFAVQAQGTVQEGVNLKARISNLSGFVAEARGQISAVGWLRFQKNRLSGTIHGEGRDLSLNTIRAGTFTADLHVKDYPLGGQPAFDLESRLESIQVGSVPVKAFHLQTTGVLKEHKAKLALFLKEGEIQGEIAGGYENGSWKGNISRLSGNEAQGFWNLQAPAKVEWAPQKFLLGPLTLKSTKGEKFQVEADLGLEPILGVARAQWESLDLSRVNPWLGNGRLSGLSAGALSAYWRESGLKFSGTSSLNGTFVKDQIRVEVISGKAHGGWDEKGLLAFLDLNFKQGGNLEAAVSSSEAVQARIPQTGKIEAKWGGIDHALLSPVFPPGLILKGQSSGEAAGQWFPGLQVEAAGAVKVFRSEVNWQTGDKPISVALQKADLNFSWRGDSLQGGIDLTLAKHGVLKGNFELPLMARIPPSFRAEGGLKISLNGQVQEKDFLAALYSETISKSRGNLDLDFIAGGTWSHPRFKGTAQLVDTAIQFSHGGESRKSATSPDLFNLEVSSGSAAMEWGEGGLHSSLNFEFKNHGRFGAKLISSEPPSFSLPKKGQMEVIWSGLNLALLNPLGPKQVSLEGMAAGQIKGIWLPGFRLETTGELKLIKGKMSWRAEKGLISAGMNQGNVDFSWKGDCLQGNLALSLETYGSFQGNFSLPIPARIPFQIDPAGKVQAAFHGQAQENGLLTAFFPGTIQETRGNMNLDLGIDGTWGKPILKGTVQLANAGALLPGLGIRVEALSARFQFQDEQIRIESFQARSGPGRVEGIGVLWLKNWEIEQYEGKIWGDKFLILYLPDLRIQSSPKLEFKGNLKHLSVRGEILLPEVLVQAPASPSMIRTSSDVVIIDQPPPGPASYSMDIQVRIILGDKVVVKTGGIEARLEGNMDLQAAGIQSEQITGRGEIRVKEGSYTGYGLRLRIDRGRFLFAGGPIDNPALDILALRRDDDLERLSDIKVGVLILGNLKRPTVKLYSIPAMKDEDILSYLLEGRPYERQSANLGLLRAGAEALLAGDSPGPVDKLKSKMGIDRVDIESQSGDLSRSMVTIGKYLTPKLYLSYGYSLFDSEQVLKVRYRISKSWEVEAQRGTAAAVDLYYRIDFF